MPHPPHPPGSEPDLQRLLRDLDGIVWVLDAATGACTFVSEAIRRLIVMGLTQVDQGPSPKQETRPE